MKDFMKKEKTKILVGLSIFLFVVLTPYLLYNFTRVKSALTNSKALIYHDAKTNEKTFSVTSPVTKKGSDDILSGTSEEIQNYYDKKGWTDGLPIIPPTEEKVNEYLQYTPYKADDVIYNGYTASTVAVNAIMAGVPAEYMPICIAFVKSFNDSAWLRELADSHGRTPIALINGPISRQLGIDNEQGMISSDNNRIISRFITLSLQNIAGYKIGENDTFGTVGSFVFSENEEADYKIGWDPYHVQEGHKLNSNTITVTTTLAWGNNVTPATPDAEQTMQVIAFDMTEKDTLALGSGDSKGYRTLFITESVASNLATKYKTKEELENALISTAVRPLGLKTYANYYGNPNENVSKKYSFNEYYNKLLTSEKTSNKIPSWYQNLLPNKSSLDVVSVLEKGKTRIIVTGDSTRNKTQVMTGGSSQTIEIELPSNWDSLINKLNEKPYYNFEPISNYYIGTNNEKKEITTNSETSAQGTTSEEVQYSVLSPMAYSKTEMIEQAPRLDTLDGKTIAIVGRSFNAPITQAVLKELILNDYPTAKILTVDDIGLGGIYSITHQSTQSKEFQQRLKDNKVDAVISGNCGCGLCTVKESGSAIAAEYIGIPSVTIGATSFVAEIRSTGTNRGVPVLRAVEYPGAFSADSVSVLRQKTRDILYPGVVKALTTQISQEEKETYAKEGYRAYDDILVSGTYDMIQTYYRMNGLSDGLPVNLPTKEKVEEYLKYTAYEGNDIIGGKDGIPLAYREVRVYTIAVNAIMAGVPPEYMPLCVAFVENMSDPEWRRTLASTHGWTPYAWINGPVARQLGIANGTGMMNNTNNKKLARFIEFAMSNLGGYYIKENRMGTFGYLNPWVFSEDEKSSTDIGWSPYHVSQGYDINSNTLTSASVLYWGNALSLSTDNATDIKNVIAFDITEKQQNGLGNTNPQVWRTMYITPDVAKKLSSQYKTKSDFEDALVASARRPLWLRTYANYWANTGSYQFNRRTIEEHYQMLAKDEAEQAKMTEVPEWYKSILTGEKQIMTTATLNKGETPILVVGDANGGKAQTMPGGGYATVEIKLPYNWDNLMAEKGYAPLNSFYIKENDSQEESVDLKGILNDGTYRVVASKEQVDSAEKVYSENNTITYWNGTKSVDAEINNKTSKIISAIGTSSTFTVENGTITSYDIRPASASYSSIKDLSNITKEDLKDATVTFAVNTKTSSTLGGITPSGTSLVVSQSIDKFKINLDGENIIIPVTATDLLSYDGEFYTLNHNSTPNSKMKVGVENEDGSYRTLEFTFNKNGTYTISYTDKDNITDASYQVEYYQQNLTLDGYDLVETSGIQVGNVGDNVVADIKDYTGFEYDEQKSSVSGTLTQGKVLVLKVYYNRNKYTVNIIDNGNVLKTIQVPYKGEVDLSELSLSKTGYTYKLDKQLNHITENINASIIWTPVEYSIDYKNTKESINNNPEKYTIENGIMTLSNLDDIVDTSNNIKYVFKGWYDKEENGTRITSIDSKELSNITLYAYWDEEKITNSSNPSTSENNSSTTPGKDDNSNGNNVNTDTSTNTNTNTSTNTDASTNNTGTNTSTNTNIDKDSAATVNDDNMEETKPSGSNENEQIMTTVEVPNTESQKSVYMPIIGIVIIIFGITFTYCCINGITIINKIRK